MNDGIFLTRFYPFPPEEVWSAIATSEALAAWLMPNDFKLIGGHEFTFRTKSQPGFNGVVHCKVLHFEINKNLSFTWRGGPMKKDTTVEFVLEPTEGGTTLHLRHTGFEGFVNRYFVRFILGSGWKNLLNKKMKDYLQP